MIFYHPNYKLHHPKKEFDGNGLRAYPETPDRVDNIIDVLASNNIAVAQAKLYPKEIIFSIHSPDYVNFIESIPQTIKEISPTAINCGGKIVEESSFYAKLGHYFSDPATPITPETFLSAISSVSVALETVTQVINNGNFHFALNRPPGHHAGENFGGGYCIFNNIAIAAKKLISKGKSVSILDLDYHHGNGTQSIFYSTDKVQYVSLHADPTNSYPFYWGFKDERGQGLGSGFNMNFPLVQTIGFEDYFEFLKQAISEINNYQPDVVLVSMGFDSYFLDPIAGMNLNIEDYYSIGEILSNFNKMVVILEGGYNLKDLGDCFLQFYNGITK